MKASQFSENAQLIAFVLQKGSEWDPKVIELLEKIWGPIRHKGRLFAFDKTDYYKPEMGDDLYRGSFLLKRKSRQRRLLKKRNAAMR